MKAITTDQPWLMPEVIDWLDSVLIPGNAMRPGVYDSRVITVLETGAGGSTVFFAHRAHRLITYEHDPKWVPKEELGNLDLRLWPNYSTAGLGTQIPLLDLAFIDGRGRVRSVLDVLKFIRPGGWLVLDDSNRDRYQEARMAAAKASSARIIFSDTEGNETTAWRIKG